MRLDARRELADLNAEWETCTKCELGERRQLVGGKFVAGEGAPRGIMFIGEGPGRTEEAYGRPFVGRSGKLLREVLRRLNILDVSYITNIVACRSCKQEVDANGQPVLRQVRGVSLPKYKDQPPLPAHINACLPRLYEEIYIVDPLLIVTLGATAAATLMKRPVSILNEAGHETHIEIPGVTQVPVLTEKKGQWLRKVRGQLVAPTTRNMVRYLCIPTLHPAFVARSAADHAENSPMRRFFAHIKSAASDYIRLAEYYGIPSTVDTSTPSTATVEEVWDAVEEDEGE